MMKDLLEKLDLIQCAIIKSKCGKDLLWHVHYLGVSSKFDENPGDDIAFEKSLANPTVEHYRDGMTFICALLDRVVLSLKANRYTIDTVVPFATAREAFNLISPFVWSGLRSPDETQNELIDLENPGIKRAYEIIESEFDEVVSLLNNIRADLLRAYAAIRLAIGDDTHQEIEDYKNATDLKILDLRNFPEKLNGQSLVLFNLLYSAQNWVTFDRIAATKGAFRVDDPDDDCIIKALKRLRDSIIDEGCSIELSKTARRARLERF